MAGTIGIFGLVFLAPSFAEAALAFGPPEYFSLMVLGFVVLSNVTGTSLLKSLMIAVVGMIIGTMGMDPVTGAARFTFESMDLLGGIEFVAVAIGLFGIGEVLGNVEKPPQALEERSSFPIVEGSLPPRPPGSEKVHTCHSQGHGDRILSRVGPGPCACRCHQLLLHD